MFHFHSGYFLLTKIESNQMLKSLITGLVLCRRLHSIDRADRNSRLTSNKINFLILLIDTVLPWSGARSVGHFPFWQVMLEQRRDKRA